jgi:hypothetical protein
LSISTPNGWKSLTLRVDQALNHGDGGDHAVPDQLILPADHEPSPGANDAGVHWQDVPGDGDLIDPEFDFLGSCNVLSAGDFHAGL